MKIKLPLMIFFMLWFVPMFAQLKIIPFCPSKNIDIYSSKFEKKYHLFDEYHGFINAELLQISDSSYIIDIYYKPKGKIYLAEKRINYKDLITIRKKIKSINIRPISGTTQYDINAKLRFNLGSATSSLLGYSWMVPEILKVTNPKIFVGVGLVSASLGFFIPMALTSRSNITPSEAVFKNYGQIKGFADGFIVYSLFDKEFEHFQPQNFIYPLSFSIAEGTMGYFIAKKIKMQYITALTARTYSLYGYYWAAMLGLVFNGSYSGMRIPMLITNFASAAGGYYISKNFNFSRGDNRILFGTTLLANSWAATINQVFEFDNPSFLFLTAASAGIATGTFLGIKHNISATKAVLTNLSAVGAGLFFGGITAVISQSPLVSFLVASSASTGTFIWLYKKYSIQNTSNRISFRPQRHNFSVSFNPAAYLTFKHLQKNILNTGNSPLIYNKLFYLRYNF